MKKQAASNPSSVAKLKTAYGEISFNESVITSLVESLIREVPGIHEIQLRRWGKTASQSSRVSVATGEHEYSVHLELGVWLIAPCNAVEIATQVQAKLAHELPAYLGLKVEKTSILIENLIFES